MEYINRIELLGIVGQVHVQQISEQLVVRFALATERTFTNHEGDITIETTWFNVTAWQNDAMPDLSRLEKGSIAHVKGRLRVRTYTDDNGGTRTFYEVMAASVHLLNEP
ncbi:MAG: single-stranded DNA-binding protein [Bacteroidales bacterium]|nr:single-stranded DNA-binding protein [Bacteroidales bacterium]